MSVFIEEFKPEKGKALFDEMRRVAMSLLPRDKAELNRLYEENKRGRAIPDDEDHLNLYLYSYGKMHKAKLLEAFNGFQDMSRLFDGNVDIYDWGCGQGTASICLLDYLEARLEIANLQNSIDNLDRSRFL